MKMNKIKTRVQWTDSDNKKLYDLYLEMLTLENKNEKFNKSKMFRELGEKLGRSKSSCECKAMNCSAVRQNLLNMQIVTGLKPLNNYNHSLAKLICERHNVEYVK